MYTLPALTGRRHGPWTRLLGTHYRVFTGRVDRACSRVVLTGAREHGPRTRGSKTTPMLDIRVQSCRKK